VDLEAVFLARENLRLHSFGPRVGLSAAGVEAFAGRFDLVIANLLPQEFLPIRARVRALVAAGGRLVLSGIPRENEADVLKRVRPRGWRLAGRRAEKGWVCLCLERG
jgi:ribosomal protein L11 methyltransferase